MAICLLLYQASCVLIGQQNLPVYILWSHVLLPFFKPCTKRLLTVQGVARLLSKVDDKDKKKRQFPAMLQQIIQKKQNKKQQFRPEFSQDVSKIMCFHTKGTVQMTGQPPKHKGFRHLADGMFKSLTKPAII